VPGIIEIMQKPPLIALLVSPKLWDGALPWIVGLLGLCNALVLYNRPALAAEREANLLAASREQGMTGGESGHSAIRYDISKGGELGRYLPFMPDARAQPLVILCGMSQMYAINETKPGDETISERMDDETAPKGTRVFGLAAPNLCNEEALLLFLTAISNPRTKPRVFVYGLCFDKFRNIDLRPTYQTFLAQRPELLELWESTARAAATKYPQASQKMLASRYEAVVAGSKSNEEGVESRLRPVIARWVPLVADRKELNAAIQFQAYLLRNKLLRIKPTTKRPIIEGRNQLNREFLQLMIDVAHQQQAKLALYVIPLNPLHENPYVPEQYAQFKQWSEALCRGQGIPFVNIENAVPAEHWGTFLDGPDFKHFKGEGHRLTAQALLKEFGPLLLGETATQGSKQ
jgi:hypothetical protein